MISPIKSPASSGKGGNPSFAGAGEDSSVNSTSSTRMIKPSISTLIQRTRSISIDSPSPQTPQNDFLGLRFKIFENERMIRSEAAAQPPEGAHPPSPSPHHPYRRAPMTDTCNRCRRKVRTDDQPVSVANKTYHRACYSCFFCRTQLDLSVSPLQIQGNIYCQKDYDLAVRKPACTACEMPIEPHIRPIRALGRYYHPEHIRCFHCRKTIDPDMTGLVERKGKFFCRPDFNLLYLPKCQACKRAVEKEAVSSKDGKLQGKWHKHCFRCQLCHCSFPNNVFYIYENAPYCRRDYHQLNGSLCHACDEPVEGRCAETQEGWRFHPQCFTCSVCHSGIRETIYYVHEGKLMCFQDRNIRAERRHTRFSMA
ncbi:uncharacterized protein BYT42DRAFT_561864 [Radiomyces spectabilis]|uniref:uncharacterized protein n=1 Tax=Radiomyces spectabilis TaxID=64574 RepID=UPI00221F8FE6|nr:uncharacterized protein BYT42DRAFT_561864 [Radiomyces spectabilis]KAI8384243.1 hypothetical protein BYT42DRAFT_561864 [Radiomyces spectabilis]